MTAVEVIPSSVLDQLRTIGDPPVDRLAEAAAGTPSTVGSLPQLLNSAHATLPDGGLDAGEIAPDPVMAARAQTLFACHGTEVIGALLLASLPQSYASAWASRVLTATARLQVDFRRRIVGTSQFVLLAMRAPTDAEPASQELLWEPRADGTTTDPPAVPEPWRACWGLRLTHAGIRAGLTAELASEDPATRAATERHLGPENRTPINQEDLLATLLTFTVSVFEVLERFGMAWTVEDQQAYMHAWDLVGCRLGIGTSAVRSQLGRAFQRRLAREGWVGLRPPTIEASRQLLAQLRARQWMPRDAPDVPASSGPLDARSTSSRDGRLLVRALLNELAAAMPPRERRLPLVAIRLLAPDVVRDRLNLGGGGALLSALDLLPRRRVPVAPFTVHEAPNPVAAAVTRSLCNEVTRRAIVRFLRTERILIPGLRRWSTGLIDPVDVGIT